MTPESLQLSYVLLEEQPLAEELPDVPGNRCLAPKSVRFVQGVEDCNSLHIPGGSTLHANAALAP